MNRYLHFKFFFSVLILFLSLNLSSFARNVSSTYNPAHTSFVKKSELNLRSSKLNRFNKVSDFLLSKNVKQHDINSILNEVNKNSITLSKKNSNGFVIIEEILEFFFGDPTKDKYNYSYDEKGNNIEVLSTFWENSSWMNNSLEVSTFGTMTQRTESLLKFWQNNLWINRFKSEYSYDANSNMIQRIEYELKNSWVLSSRQSYVYDENNNELEWRMEWRDGDKWVPFIQVLSTYDESGNILTSTFKWGNNEGTAFENSSMQEYIYDANNNLIELKSKYWDSGEWIDEGSEIYTYNEDGSVEILVQYIGDSQPTKILMTYNEYQNITSSTTSVLQEDGVTWIEVYRETYTYDENQNNISHLAENYWNGTSWEVVVRETRTFQQMITDVDDFNTPLPQNFELEQNYPNPFNPETNISYSLPNDGFIELAIFDVLGNKVEVIQNKYQSAGSYSHLFDASNFTSGIYFYRLQTDGFVETKKMILIK